MNDKMAKLKLMKIIKELNNGSSVLKLVKHYNLDHRIEWQSLSRLPIEIAEKVKIAKFNEIFFPFKIKNQWQIIELLDKRKKDNRESYYREKATEILFQEYGEQVLKIWMMSLRNSAYIKILYPKLNILN